MDDYNDGAPDYNDGAPGYNDGAREERCDTRHAESESESESESCRQQSCIALHQ